MSRPKIPIVPLHALTPGQFADSYAVLAERHKRVTGEGKPFYSCRFRDLKRTVGVMVWGDSPWFSQCESEWKEGQSYKLRGLYGEHEKYGPQLELHNIRPVTDADRTEGFDPSQLADCSRHSPQEMLQQLLDLVATQIRDAPLQRLVQVLLDRNAQALLQLPATADRFHPFRGGWLEHVLSVTNSCILLADHYLALYPDAKPPLNRDLVIAAAVLHDIGRVRELTLDPLAPQPTIEGRLYGHLVLGRDMIRDAAREFADLHPEMLQLLEHLVLSHLALPEWGSPRLPLVAEALILHHADDLDAKVEMYMRCLSRDQQQGPFTARDPILGKPLLKQRTV